MLAVVSTPARAIWSFGIYVAILAIGIARTGMEAHRVGRAALIETPFLFFAVALVFIGTGPRTDVLGVPISIDGAWAGWALIVKGTCGVLAAALLGATTPVADVLEGLDRLRVPRPLTAIAAFMLRYLEVTSGELSRLQVARISRGDDPRWFWQGRAVAATAATLAIRSFERGERVQWAMQSRGFDGTFPDTDLRRDPLRWWPTMAVPVLAWVAAIAAILVDRYGSPL